MWIELHDGAREHPKTLKLARRLGVPPVLALGHLASLWCWTLRIAPDGDLGSFDAEDIATGAQWDGNPESFVSALVSVKLLEEGPRGLVVHDWQDYSGSLKSANRKREQRERKVREEARKEPPSGNVSQDSHGTVTGQSCDSPRTVTRCHADRPTDRPTDRPSGETGGKRDTTPANKWPTEIATTADFEAAAGEWNWKAGNLKPTTIATVKRIVGKGPIAKHEFATAREKTEAKISASDGEGRIKYFLATVEGQRKDAADESRKTSPPPVPKPEQAPEPIYLRNRLGGSNA